MNVTTQSACLKAFVLALLAAGIHFHVGDWISILSAILFVMVIMF